MRVVFCFCQMTDLFLKLNNIWIDRWLKLHNSRDLLELTNLLKNYFIFIRNNSDSNDHFKFLLPNSRNFDVQFNIIGDISQFYLYKRLEYSFNRNKRTKINGINVYITFPVKSWFLNCFTIVLNGRHANNILNLYHKKYCQHIINSKIVYNLK